MPHFKPGDLVVYRKSKHSECPGPRAADVQPAPRGDLYTYNVDKFWLVVAVSENGESVIVRTRRGKQHSVDVGDPRLRPASLWQRWWQRDRFPTRQIEMV